MLGPLLFLINDLVDCCERYSDIYVFADDAKFYRHIAQPQDFNLLQALNILQSWSQKWLLSLNTKKCKVVSFGRNTDKSHIYTILDHSNQELSLIHI